MASRGCSDLPCPWAHSLNPSKCLLMETSYRETFSVSQHAQPDIPLPRQLPEYVYVVKDMS